MVLWTEGVVKCAFYAWSQHWFIEDILVCLAFCISFSSIRLLIAAFFFFGSGKGAISGILLLGEKESISSWIWIRLLNWNRRLSLAGSKCITWSLLSVRPHSCAHPHLYLWRSEVDIECFLLSLSTLFFWDRVSYQTETHCLARLAGQQVPGIPDFAFKH